MAPNLLNCVLPLLEPKRFLSHTQKIKSKELKLHYYTSPRVPIPGLYTKTRKHGLVLCYIREQPHHKKHDIKEFEDLFISRVDPVIQERVNDMQKKNEDGGKLKLVDAEDYYSEYISSSDDSYDSGYDSGYDSSYDSSYDSGYDSGYDPGYYPDDESDSDSSSDYSQESQSQSQLDLSNQDKEDTGKKIPYSTLEEAISALPNTDHFTTTSTTYLNNKSSYDSSSNYSQEFNSQAKETEQEKSGTDLYVTSEEIIPGLEDIEINRFNTNTTWTSNSTTFSTNETPTITSTNPTLSSIISTKTTPYLLRPRKIDTDNYLALLHPLPTHYNTVLSRPAFVAETQSRTYTFKYGGGGKMRRFFLLDDGLSFIRLPKPKIFNLFKKNKRGDIRNQTLYKIAFQGSDKEMALIQQTPVETEQSWSMIEECKNDFLGAPDGEEEDYCERIVKYWLRGVEENRLKNRRGRSEDTGGC